MSKLRANRQFRFGNLLRKSGLGLPKTGKEKLHTLCGRVNGRQNFIQNEES